MFIRADRTGDWEVGTHLHCVMQMLPHFNAAGHIAYAKSTHLYTHQVLELPHKMPGEEYRQITEMGFFTIRLLERFWNGVFSDQTIEQFLQSELFGSMKNTGRVHGEDVVVNVSLRFNIITCIINTRPELDIVLYSYDTRWHGSLRHCLLMV